MLSLRFPSSPLRLELTGIRSTHLICLLCLRARVNQDALGVQAALLAASPIDPAADRWTLREWERQPMPEPEVYSWKKGIDGMTTCD